MFEYSEAPAPGELFYPTYDLSDFSWASAKRTLNHTALTAEFLGVPATDPSGSFSNGSLAFRVSPRGAAGAAQGERGEQRGQSTFWGGNVAPWCPAR